ncbi:hypothetical protein [Luteimonas aquatica]|uniref:hypothetical protein n=1 Tax=Luteimonas aquatica TaxID=450364 RepID=UPI001F592CCD|nr:hypothetical protein [Luteimonas aquatica]
MHRHNTLACLAVVLAGLLAAGSAEAGLVGPGNQIAINTQSRVAWGSIATVRKSGNTADFIGCEYTVPASPQSPSLTCNAANSTLTVSCTSTDPQLLAAAQSLSMDVFVEFRWNSVSQCTSLRIVKSSYQPIATP